MDRYEFQFDEVRDGRPLPTLDDSDATVDDAANDDDDDDADHDDKDDKQGKEPVDADADVNDKTPPTTTKFAKTTTTKVIDLDEMSSSSAVQDEPLQTKKRKLNAAAAAVAAANAKRDDDGTALPIAVVEACMTYDSFNSFRRRCDERRRRRRAVEFDAWTKHALESLDGNRQHVEETQSSEVMVI